MKQEYVREFVSKPHGKIQVELDAMPFPTIKGILKRWLDGLIDTNLNDRIKEQSVKQAQEHLDELVKNYTFP